MKTPIALLVLVGLLSGTAFAVKSGDPAPAFSAVDSTGKTRQMADFKGKYVVLEWHNQGCPFVKKHYETKNMQGLQKKWVGPELVWLTVISSAKGKQGGVTPAQANAYLKKMDAAPTAVLMDSDGKVGAAFGARTTPHMFLIHPDGRVIYQGAIDDKNSTDPETVKTAKNYLVAALEEARAGKPVSEPATEPYGCSVKY